MGRESSLVNAALQAVSCGVRHLGTAVLQANNEFANARLLLIPSIPRRESATELQSG